jgi:cell division protein FtsZ
MLEFNMPKNKSSKIKVIGVGGGGTNAVNHMYREGIKDVDLIVANTDRQSLDASPVLNKIQLGVKLTEGLGAGTKPQRGKEAAEESLTELRELLSVNTKMLFITAGMGGGTGTGGAPVIAQLSREMGILTVGIVTTPFDYEGRDSKANASSGIEELKKHVDALIVVSNETLRAEFGNMDIDNAYSKADDILATAAKSIAECITTVGTQNVDFEDVRVALANSGVAIIGNGMAEGKDRALRATEMALESRLLNDKEINGAKFILINVTYGKNKITLDELNEIAMYVQNQAGNDTQIKQGRVFDDTQTDKISVTIIAAGFNNVMNIEKKINSQHDFFLTTESKSEKVDKGFSLPESTIMELNVSNDQQIVNEVKNNVANTAIEVDMVDNVLNEIELENQTPAVGLVNINEIIFEITNPRNIDTKKDDLSISMPVDNPNAILASINNGQIDELRQSNMERDKRKEALRNASYKINGSKPAFEGKNLPFVHMPAAKVDNMSSYSLVQNANEETEVRKNPYLHDQVD